MFSYVLAIFIIYLAYRFIVGFVLPIVSASRNMHEKIKTMNENMPRGQQQNSAEGSQKERFSTSDKNASAPPSSKDYLDFEEIK